MRHAAAFLDTFVGKSLSAERAKMVIPFIYYRRVVPVAQFRDINRRYGTIFVRSASAEFADAVYVRHLESYRLLPRETSEHSRSACSDLDRG